MVIRLAVKRKFLDVGFLMLEAGMHLYLVAYLLWIGANIPVILFTAFELVMFVKLLFSKKKELRRVPCTWHEVCCLEEKAPSLGEKHMIHYRYCNCLADNYVCCLEDCDCK